MFGRSFTCWNVRAMPLAAIWRGANVVMSSSRNRIRPAFGFAVPVIRLSSVVLPAPFGPIRPRTSPGLTSKLTSLTAANAPNRLVAPSIVSTGRPADGGARAACERLRLRRQQPGAAAADSD